MAFIFFSVSKESDGVGDAGLMPRKRGKGREGDEVEGMLSQFSIHIAQ
jgi:hypothetical protein